MKYTGKNIFCSLKKIWISFTNFSNICVYGPLGIINNIAFAFDFIMDSISDIFVISFSPTSAIFLRQSPLKYAPK